MTRRGFADRVPKGLGCLVAPFVLLAPLLVVVPLVVWMMSASHSVADAASELSLRPGPSYGWDGWYVGEWRGVPVALAATYAFGAGAAPEVQRARRRPMIDVAIRIDAASVGGAVDWDGKAWVGTGTLPAHVADGATRFARDHGSLTIGDAGAGPWPFEAGVVCHARFPGDVPSPKEVEAMFDALLSACR